MSDRACYCLLTGSPIKILNKNEKNKPNNPENENGLIHLIKVGSSTYLKMRNLEKFKEMLKKKKKYLRLEL